MAATAATAATTICGRKAKRQRLDTMKLDLDEWMHRIETTTRTLDMTHVQGIPTVRAMLAWLKERGEVWSQLSQFKMPPIKMGLRTVEQLERFSPALVHLDLSGVLKHSDEVLPFSSTQLQHLTFPRASRMTDAGLQCTLNACPQLRSMVLLECNQVSDLSMEHALVACQHLTRVKLERCTWVTGKTLYYLSGANYNQLHTLTSQVGSKATQLDAMARSAAKGGSGGASAATTMTRASQDVFKSRTGTAKIQKIELDKCEALCSASLLHLKHFPSDQLRSLSLKGCVAIDASLASHVARAQHLELLDLTWTHADDDSIRTIARTCHSLRFLALAHCEDLTDHAIWWLTPRRVVQDVQQAETDHSTRLELRQLSLRACSRLSKHVGPLLCLWQALRWVDLGGMPHLNAHQLERCGWKPQNYQQFERGEESQASEALEEARRAVREEYDMPSSERITTATQSCENMGELLEMFGQ